MVFAHRSAPFPSVHGFSLGLLIALTGCGGGGGSAPSAPPPVTPPVVTSLPGIRLSAASPFVAGCDGAVAVGTLYVNAEVEPSVALNPANPANLVAAWQQDRWSDGGARGLVTASSFDSGRSWTRTTPLVAHCAGGAVNNGADFERASDPWLTFAADGTVYMMSLSFTGATFVSGSTGAMLVLRSSDGGASWSSPIPLINDGSAFFDDKGAIAADNVDAHVVYAVWDRLTANNSGPIYFARTIDSGTSWQPARAIYDPGVGNQTIGNIPVSLPGGALMVVFTEFDAAPQGTTATLKVIRSSDRGMTWSAPSAIAPEQSAPLRDPNTNTMVRDGAGLPSVAVDGGGRVYVVWQSSSFSNGQRDAIAISHSTDAGQTWSMPTRVSGSLTSAAFIPNVHVRGDGTLGVGYYDLRSNVPSSGKFQADYWLATSLDGATWLDTHVSGPFPLGGAPNAEGLFLGDYQALTSSGGEFLPVFVTASADAANRTDVFIAFAP